MNRTRRRLQIVTAGVVVAAWAALYVVVITTAPLNYDPATESAAKVNREFALLLAVPTALWVTAALLLVNHWWRQAGAGVSGLDGPARLLAAATATLPADRRDWGAAMTAELAQVQDPTARWRFAAGCTRTAIFPPGGSRAAVGGTGALAGCLGLALRPPRWLLADRPGRWLGMAMAIVLVGGSLLVTRLFQLG